MLCSRQASQTVLNSCKNSPLYNYNLSPQSAHSRRTGSASFFIEELFTPQLLLSSSCCCTRSFSAAFQGLSSSASRASPKRCWFGDGNSAHWELPRIPSWDDGWKGIWRNPFRHLICFLFIFPAVKCAWNRNERHRARNNNINNRRTWKHGKPTAAQSIVSISFEGWEAPNHPHTYPPTSNVNPQDTKRYHARAPKISHHPKLLLWCMSGSRVATMCKQPLHSEAMNHGGAVQLLELSVAAHAIWKKTCFQITNPALYEGDEGAKTRQL